MHQPHGRQSRGIVSQLPEQQPQHQAAPQFVPDQRQSADLITALRRHMRPSSLQGAPAHVSQASHKPLQAGSVGSGLIPGQQRPMSSRGNLPRSKVLYSDWVNMQQSIAGTPSKAQGAVLHPTAQHAARTQVPSSTAAETASNPLQQYLAGDLQATRRPTALAYGSRAEQATAAALSTAAILRKGAPAAGPAAALQAPAELAPPKPAASGAGRTFESRADMGLELSDDEGGLF